MKEESSSESIYSFDGISEFLEILWDFKRFIISFTFLVTILSIFITFFLTPKYLSSSLLESKNDEANRFSNIPSIDLLGGITGLNSPLSNNVNLVVETLSSRDFFNYLYKDDLFLANLIATKGYEKNKIVYDESIFLPSQLKWIKKPSKYQAHKIFLNNYFSINKSRETGFIKLSIEHLSPEISQSLLLTIIEKINSYSKNKKISEAKLFLNYLNIESAKANSLTVKNAISKNIEMKIQELAFLNSTEEIVLSTIESPYLTEERSKPQKKVIVISSMLFSLFFSSIISIVYALRKRYL